MGKYPRFTGFCCGALAAAALWGLGSPALAAYQKQATLHYTGVRVTLDGRELALRTEQGAAVEPFLLDGTAYLPVRGIADALGLDVQWDGASQTVALSSAAAAPQTQQTQLKLRVTDCNVRFEVASGPVFEYAYDEKTCAVKTQSSGQVTTLDVAPLKPEYNHDAIHVIRIPEGQFSSIVLEGNSAGVSLPALPVDYDLAMEHGALSVALPLSYANTLRYQAVESACSIKLEPGATDYTLDLDAGSSAVSLPKDWGVQHPGDHFQRVQGNGAAQLHITLDGCAFSITEE